MENYSKCKMKLTQLLRANTPEACYQFTPPSYALYINFHLISLNQFL